MPIAEQIYEVAKPLPESLALEALHFIEYPSSPVGRAHLFVPDTPR